MEDKLVQSRDSYNDHVQFFLFFSVFVMRDCEVVLEYSNE
jgi:hypothetical protein